MDSLDIIKQHFIPNLPALGKGLGIGIAGFVLIGAAYFAWHRWRGGQPITPRLLWSDVFARYFYQGPSARIDIVCYFPTVFFFGPLSGVVIALTGTLIGSDVFTLINAVAAPVPWTVESKWVAVALQFLGIYYGLGLANYLIHYAFHRVPLLWAVHRVHHSAEKLNFFSGARGHPIEGLAFGAARVSGSAVGTGVTLYLTGTKLLPETLAIVAGFAMFQAFYGSLSHSHMPISFGKWGNILLDGPVTHQIHHSAELRHRDKNMGPALFDWMFGTLYLPEKGEEYRWGLNDEEIGEASPYQKVRDFYFEPFHYGARHIRDNWLRRKGPAPEGKILPAE